MSALALALALCRRVALAALMAAGLFLLGGCGGALPAVPPSFVDLARSAARDSEDPEVVGRWLLAELVAPGGDSKRARLARLRLGELGGEGRYASLARGLEADVHGRFPAAAEAYLDVLARMRESAAADAPLLAWFAANRLIALRHAVTGLWSKARGVVEQAIDAPGHIGWRARGELVQWWSRERVRGRGQTVDAAVFDAVAERQGCLREALIAGPFGHAPRSDHRVHFEAEGPGPWPARFRDNRRRLEHPRTHTALRHGCLLRAEGGGPQGIYYVQTFIELPERQEVLVAVQGAFALFVNDVEVLTRDGARWGVWPRYGVHLVLPAGRHRILARIGSAETYVRVLEPSGSPLGLRGSADQRPPYSLVPPVILTDPNVLEPYLRALRVPRQAGAPKRVPAPDLDDPVLRYVASYLAHIEGQDDLASVILEPLVRRASAATAVALAQQAVFSDSDPIFARSAAMDLARDLRQRAVEQDPELWGPRLWLVLEKAEQHEPRKLVTDLDKLARQFPDVPLMVKRQAAAFHQLGWVPEHARAVSRGAAHFAEDVELLEAMLRIHERRGERAKADALAARIRQLEPSSEVEFQRALQRHDFPAAIAELERIGAVRQHRRDIALRVADLLVRAGQSAESLAKLEVALTKDPTDAGARLALADARFAAGDQGALTGALVEAIRTGADTGRLRNAIEMVEGMTDLAPYRRDGQAIIAEAEASGLEMPGTAARLLDYVTLWVEPDGSARMLEHEIIRVQSREGIEQHAEQHVPRGVVLRMRTIKKDGRVFEPETIAGKPTVTMPHLEVGDYIETESIWLLSGDGQGGRAFLSPRWLFREKNVSYHWSEFVVVSPRNRPLSIETTGDVPDPVVEQSGALVVRRWRVDRSVALPEERFAAPAEEFLPSVRVGWGIDQEERIRRLIDAHRDETRLDPRLRRIARSIVAGRLVADRAAERPKPARDPSVGRTGSPKGTKGASSPAKGGAGRRAAKKASSVDTRARRIYRWVLDNIQPGKERSAPKAITGKSGDRAQAFMHLCRLVGIDARLGVVQNRLSPPPTGPFSEALRFSAPAVRVVTEHGARWLTVRERFAPYGYLPSALRDQPAVLVDLARPQVRDEPPPIVFERTAAEGAQDGILNAGTLKLAADGTGKLELLQRYHGKYAIMLRTRLSSVPEPRLRDVLEGEVLGVALPGARIRDLEVRHLDELDEPVELALQVDLPNVGRRTDDVLVLEVPFLPRMGALVALPSRETPLYLAEAVAARSTVRLRIELPAGAKLSSNLDDVSLSHGGRAVEVRDRMDGKHLLVDRTLTIPAGRVAPAQYAAFRRFVLAADAALHRAVRMQLGR